MDAFDKIFDESNVDTHPADAVNRRNMGRVAHHQQSNDPTPAPTDSVPAKAGEKKAASRHKTTAPVPSSPTIPRKRGQATMTTMEPNGAPSSASNSENARLNSGETHCNSASVDDASQLGHATQQNSAGVVTPIPESPVTTATLSRSALGNDLSGVGRYSSENHGAVSDAIEILVSQWRMRQRWHKAEKSLILQAKAICRGFCDGDKVKANELFDNVYDIFAYAQAVQEAEAIGKVCRKKAPFAADIDPDAQIALVPFLPAIYRFAKDRENLEKDMCKRTRTLPAYGWAMAIKGLGESGFASIVGEAGDVGSYRTVSGLWKRMGLAVINGERQRRVSDADLAIVHGYSPSRRSVAWNVGNGLIGGMGNGYRPIVGEDIEANENLTHYAKMFVQRCRYLVERDAEKFSRGTSVKEGVERESYSKHCASSAKRYVEKKFLRDLYAAWRRETIGEIVDPEIAWRRDKLATLSKISNSIYGEAFERLAK